MRSYFGKLVPQTRSAEYFGFYDVFGKLQPSLARALRHVYMLTVRASIGNISLLILFGSGGLLLIFAARICKRRNAKCARQMPDCAGLLTRFPPLPILNDDYFRRICAKACRSYN
jgi:MFS-type transporter involved in bile tolerance (Atg22 family)